jgi:hypothetical protein
VKREKEAAFKIQSELTKGKTLLTGSILFLSLKYA